MVDYIIVGAGSAGCVLANRLSADPNNQVLLLEAGKPDRNFLIHIPAAFSRLFKTDVDWNYITTPQKHLNNRELYTPRGKVLGGSSSINAMIYMRGHAKDYDHWAQLGNEEWSYADVLPYFVKMEHNESIRDDYHGQGGFLNVTDLAEPNPITTAFLQAAAEQGHPIRDDFNGADQTGVGYFQVTQKNQKRHSAAAAYLKPVLNRPNLQVITEAHVTQLMFDGLWCVGVQYQRHNQRHSIQCRREVLLCGGAINSPQLLLLSGIGDGTTLQQQGIDILHHLPGVGQNLHDHVAYPIAYHSKQSITLDKADSIGNLLRYVLFKRGQLRSNVAEAGGFVQVHEDAGHPNLQFMFGPAFFLDHGFTKPKGHGISIGPVLVLPKSRGELTLRSNDPFDYPNINPNYLAHEQDLDVLVQGYSIATNIMQSAALESYVGQPHTPNHFLVDRTEIEAHVRQTAETLYHPVGTCKMGADEMAVVDQYLHVHGIQGLRVVDASIMPSIVNGNTNAPTMMIAEKAADYILSGE